MSDDHSRGTDFSNGGRLSSTRRAGPPIERERVNPLVDGVFAEIRYSWRGLRRARGYVIAAASSLALGIGGAAVVFSVLLALLFPRLPYTDTERLAIVQPSPTWAVFQGLAASDAFDTVAAYNEQAANLVGPAGPERVLVGRVTDGFMRVARLRIVAGRGLSDGDFRAGHEQVALLTSALWRSHFGADKGVVGRAVSLDDRSYTIIGVADEEFRAPTQLSSGRGISLESGPALLTPLLGDPLASDPSATDRLWRGLNIIVHLRGGVEITRANSELGAIVMGAVSNPARNRDYTLLPFSHVVRGDLPRQLAVVTVAVALLLLVACANFANLALGRWSLQMVEHGTRMALGAGRARLVRMSLVETMSVALVGGVAGLGLAVIGVRLVASLGGELLTGLDTLVLDDRVVAFGIGLTFCTGVVVGTLPAIRFTALDASDVLRGEQGTAIGPRRIFALSSLFVVLEIAVCFGSLMCAGVLARSLFNESRVDLGFRTAGVLTADISISRLRYPTPTQARSFFRELVDRASALPGVQTVSLGNTVPGGPATTIANVRVRRDIENSTGDATGEQSDSFVRYETVTPNYFAALSIQMRAGRAFTDRDATGATSVAVVNETFARNHWLGTGSALGRQISFGRRDFTIVGVSDDVRSVRSQAESMVYFLYDQFPQPPLQMTLFLRLSSDRLASALPLRHAVQSLDPSQPVYNVLMLERVVFASLARFRFISAMAAVFSVLAVLIAVLGLYSNMSRTVNERRSELAIRLAIGSSPGRLFRDVLARGFLLVFIGIGLGVPAAYALVGVLGARIVGLDGSPEVGALVGTIVTVSVCSIGGVIVPAVRAASVDSIAALRRL